MKRFDNRDKETFSRDIKFGTMMEQLWMRKCLPEIIKHNIYPGFISLKDNGVDNTGEFQERSNGNADFIVTTNQGQHPLEVKWAPTKGKITLKLHDLTGYLNQGADILVIYNNSNVSLKQPTHTDYSQHWAIIEKYMDKIQWGIIYNSSIRKILELTPQKIFYMGGKQGFIINESAFHHYFILRNF